jgi:hypothetical protein
MKDKIMSLCDEKIEGMSFVNSDHWFDFHSKTRELVGHLVENRVVVLPVKPGDTVYTIHRGKIKEWKVYYVGMNTLEKFMFNFADADLQNSRSACDEDIGETVFLTEEDAINELKERKAYQ